MRNRGFIFGFTLVELMIVLAIIAIIASIVYGAIYNREPETLVPTVQPNVEEVDFQNDAGQYVVNVKINDLNSWLVSHKDCEIVTMTAVSPIDSQCNPTTGFVVVYRRIQQK